MCDICRKQEIEKAYKALKLNGFASSDYPYGYDYDHSHNPKLLAASAAPTIKEKPTVWIKRLKFGGHRNNNSPNNIHLKGASFIQQRLKLERENAEKALRLNGAF